MLLYLAAAVCIWWRVWGTGSPGTSISCACGDPVQELWWLDWLPWAIVHGHDPFFSNALFAGSGGVNALTNTSFLFPAFVLAPITWIFGPIASFNVIATLAPVASAYAMFLFCRAFTRFLPAQVLAGALYGFSPFIISNLPLGHAHLVLAPFPPLIALLVYKVVGEDRRSAIWLGAGVGVLIVLQYFTGSELMAITVVGALAGLVPILLWKWRTAWRHRRRALTAAGVALAVALPLLAYPVDYELRGPRHTIGVPWPDNAMGQAASTIVDPLHHLSSSLLPVSVVRYYGALGPPLGYLGWALIAFLGLSVVVWYRRPVAWGALVLGVFSWQLSVGVPLHGRRWTLWRPFAHIPIVKEIQPYRFSELVFLSAAVLLALSLQGWNDLLPGLAARRPHSARLTGRSGRRLGWAVTLAATLGAVGVLVPIVDTYALPLAAQADPAPAWFRTDALRLAPGTRVLTIPYASSIRPDAMAWQAEDNFSFDLVGGYALVPGQDGRHDNWVDPLQGAPALLVDLSFGDPPPQGTVAQLRELHRAFVHWGVDVIVIPEGYTNAAYDAALITAAAGAVPRLEEGSYVWRIIGARPFTDLPPLAFFDCARLGRGLVGPDCVTLRELAATARSG